MFRDYHFPRCVMIGDCFWQCIVIKDYYFSQIQVRLNYGYTKIMLPQSIVIYNISYINSLIFSVLSQNIGESVTFVSPMEQSWYICFNTAQSLVFLMLLQGIVGPQLYSGELICESGFTIVLCLCQVVFPFEN